MATLRYLLFSLCILASLSTQAGNIPSTQLNSWHRDPGKLDLASVNALVMDTRNNAVLYSRNPNSVVPIASLSKLMTVMVILDAKQPLDERIAVAIQSTNELKNVFSRVRVDSQLTRKEMLLLTLMSSENRAAASLAHHYPGGYAKFIEAMNSKAKALGMHNTHFVEPTGLSYLNVSTAHDLAAMVSAASGYALIKEMSTTAKKDAHFSKPSYSLAFYNTNPLVRNGNWNITLSKTGFNNMAGHCLVMQTAINNRPVTMVLLDSFGKKSHVGDAGRVRRWLETGNGGLVPASAKDYVKRKARETNLSANLN